ncbi:alpha/beta hydrolase [Shewanella sp. UCD-FRSSP16_17]|uniref:alpha/beta fold hydrolase n=1 Tax=unclassified Shewanella TaxID=196818 RepID=UPI0007EECB67|nr:MULTISPECIES: alpha/beta fold hydrolase [unclassified Shewanella]MBQ4892119.1 alpha/beta fold hydrolase [Shewanella sp. MMG014]OBT03731.1 alpha/beta hydrolase [Shewanella sp. UCD-FRSSP16_17]
MQMDSILSGIVSKKHFFSVPLNYQQPEGEKITVFAREIVSTENQHKDLPYLVYFQGGPGFGAVRPVENSGWIKRALQEFRVILLDQRGTGLSTLLNHVTLSHLSPEAQVEYVSQFRADNIIRDAETIRLQLTNNTQWSILGQSFGGFCVLQYLSAAPDSIKEAYITGGIPSLTRQADDVYQATYKRVIKKNNDFYRRFSDAAKLTAELAEFIENNNVILATGEQLTVEMLQLLGVNLGMEQGPEAVYYLLEQALIDTANGKKINPLFLHQFCQLLDFNTNPIFALMHESIYCQQFHQRGANWSAHRVREQFQQFNYQKGQRLLFTGEMIYPWMFEQFNQLKPLKDLADAVAAKSDWTNLYDVDILMQNTVPVAAAIYSEDMYVDMNYSLETAALVDNLQYWVTSEYEHNGIRVDGEHILDKLISLNRSKSLR